MKNSINKYHPDLIAAMVARNICLVPNCLAKSNAKVILKEKKHEKILMIDKSRILCESCIKKEDGIEANKIGLRKYAKHFKFKFEESKGKIDG